MNSKGFGAFWLIRGASFGPPFSEVFVHVFGGVLGSFLGHFRASGPGPEARDLGQKCGRMFFSQPAGPQRPHVISFAAPAGRLRPHVFFSQARPGPCVCMLFLSQAEVQKSCMQDLSQIQISCIRGRMFFGASKILHAGFLDLRRPAK